MKPTTEKITPVTKPNTAKSKALKKVVNNGKRMQVKIPPFVQA